MFDITRPTIGLNLSKANDWRTDSPFADIRHAFREPGQPGAPEQPYAGPRDARRWPTEQFESLIDGWAYPDGTYSADATGCNIVLRSSNMVVVYEGGGRITIKGQGGQLHLVVTPYDPDYTYSIRVPGESRDNGIWRLDYLADIRRASVFRTLDMIPSNNSPIVNPSDLVPPDPVSRTYVDWGPNALRGGPPWSDAVDLAQRTGATPWCVLPPMATMETWRAILTELAKLGRPVILEACNEPWNSQFAVQYNYLYQLGLALGVPAIQTFTANGPDAVKYGTVLQAAVTREISLWATSKPILGKNAIIVRSGRMDPWANSMTLDYCKSLGHDPKDIYGALAVAPYFGDAWTCRDGQHGFSPDMTLDDLFRGLNESLEQDVVLAIRAVVAGADAYGLPLVAYEAGQHLFGDNPPRKVYDDAQTDPRMGDLYRELFTRWKGNGGGLMCLYNHCERLFNPAAPSQPHTRWGLKTSLGDNRSPKWQAFTSVAATRNGANDPGPIVTPTPTPGPTPTPTVPPRQPHAPEGRPVVFRWIMIGEGTPATGEPVLCRTGPKEWEKGFWDGSEFRPGHPQDEEDADDFFVSLVTHWSYVPEPIGGGR